MLVRKLKGKRPLGRSRHRWKDIRTDVMKIGWEPVLGSSEHGNEPSGSIKGGEILD
jgi:hypothetical protein